MFSLSIYLYNYLDLYPSKYTLWLSARGMIVGEYKHFFILNPSACNIYTFPFIYYVCLSAYLYWCLSAKLSAYLPVCLSFFFWVYIYLPICINLSECLSVFLPICLSVDLSACWLSVFLSLSIYLSIYLYL